MEFDVIVVGSGHNGLTCGAYLAKLGMSVLVLEERGRIGGGCDTREVTLPGFKHNLHSYFHLLKGPFSPYYELELWKYGSKYVYPLITTAVPFRDGKRLVAHYSLEKTCEEIAKFSKSDARKYREFYRYFPIATYELFSRPLQEDERGRLLRRTAKGREYLELTKMTSYDLIREHFEDDHVRMFITHKVTANRAQTRAQKELTSKGAVSPGGFFRMLQAARRMGISIGGSIFLARGLSNLIFAHDGLVLTRSRASKIVVKDGVAKAVQTSDGRIFVAKKAIVSAVDHVQTLLGLVGEDNLERNLARRVKNWIWSPWTLFGVHLALKEVPRLDKDIRLNYATQIVIGYDGMEDYEKHFKDCDAGVPPKNPGGPMAIPTLNDPSQAPAGRHTCFLWQFVPYRLKSGGAEAWDSIKEDYGNRCIESLAEFFPKLVRKENILGTYCHTPLDTSRDFSNMIMGDAHQGSYISGQEGYGRPDKELSHYRTPIERLYLCGSCTHPGGSITMAPGYNAANVIAEDLGARIWWKPLKPEKFLS